MRSSLGPRKLIYLWAPVLFWAALIFFMSSLSLHNPIFDKVEKNNMDKLVHSVEYSVLGLLLARALCRHSVFSGSARRVFWAAFLIGALYGATDEYHQQFVPYRDCNVFDLMADSAGVMVGAWIWTRKQNRSYA